MITMPHRSVTRFFIPLIDVLLLLFCIFLLMPVFSEEAAPGTADKGATPRQTSADLLVTIESLERELGRLTLEMQKYEQIRKPLQELERLRKDLELLRKEKLLVLQDRLAVRVLEIDGKTGELFFFDPARRDQPRYPVDSEEAADRLIARHQKETGGDDVFYFFMFPRGETGYPTQAQRNTYKAWFGKVANSLEEKKT